MGKNLLIQTFGCQMNKLDSELITGSFISAGYKLVDSEAQADVILVNTCSVREHAEERVYSRVANLKVLKAKKPGLVIGIIGCMAQKDKEGIFKRLPHVSLVCGPHRYKSIVRQVEKLRRREADKLICADNDGLVKGEDYKHAIYISDAEHAFVQVMRGCDNFCSYCIVPYVRGKEISRPPEDIIEEVSTLASQGVTAITLLGQNVTAYGKSLKENISLASLLKELAVRQPDLAFSFITSHPADVTPELLSTMAGLPQVKKELHMPAQSGSDRILKLMSRRYTRDRYLDIVRRAKGLMPHIKIVSDFIVGFPTESDRDFRDTVSLVKEAGFSKVYVFKYSPRSGTQAAKLKDDVPLATKKERNNYLLDAFKKERL